MRDAIVTVPLSDGTTTDILVKNIEPEDIGDGEGQISLKNLCAVLNYRHNQGVSSRYDNESKRTGFKPDLVAAKLKDLDVISDRQVRTALQYEQHRAAVMFNILVKKYIAEGNMEALNKLVNK